jgi:hypothetical protein
MNETNIDVGLHNIIYGIFPSNLNTVSKPPSVGVAVQNDSSTSCLTFSL